MEHTSARLLRAAAAELPGCLPALTPREDELHHRLITAATVLMARFGFAHISLAEFILALRVTKNAFRRLFCDMEGLCGEILIRHLTELLTFVTHAAQDSPGRRAAYLTFTRSHWGDPTYAHLLLVRDRHLLPPDLREQIEALRTQLGQLLAGEHGASALALLDDFTARPDNIEPAIAAFTTATDAQPPPPQAAPKGEKFEYSSNFEFLKDVATDPVPGNFYYALMPGETKPRSVPAEELLALREAQREAKRKGIALEPPDDAKPAEIRRKA
jgi:AcrR family transcriptional regulator